MRSSFRAFRLPPAGSLPLDAQGEPRADPLIPVGPGRSPGNGRRQEREDALVAVQEAVSAALAGDESLCRLRQRQALSICQGRPHAAWAARQAFVRALDVDIVARHLRGCDRRRRLLREMTEVARVLREWAAPVPACSFEC